MLRAVRKQIAVDVRQFTQDDLDEFDNTLEFVRWAVSRGGIAHIDTDNGVMCVDSREEPMSLDVGDWLLFFEGKFDSMCNDNFRRKYDLVEYSSDGTQTPA